MIVGKVIKDKTNPPTKGTDLGIPKKLIKTARPRSPKIIDGTAAKLLILTSIKSVNLFLTAKFSKYIAVKTPTGKLRMRVTKIVIKDPIVAPKKPATSGSRLSPFKNKLLEINDLHQRALQTLKHMNVEFQRLELKNDIQSKVQHDMSQQQREYFLQQQMKTIQEELGGVSYEEEIEAMKSKSETKLWDDKTKAHFEKEIGKTKYTSQVITIQNQMLQEVYIWDML